MTEELTRLTDPRLGEAPLSELGAHRHLVVSNRLRERRRALGLTQKEVVARLRRLGVETTNKALSSLEHGAGLDVAKLPELACSLECTLTYLLGLTDDPARWLPDAGEWPESPVRRNARAPAGGSTPRLGRLPGAADGHQGRPRPAPREGHSDPCILGPLDSP